MKRPQDRATAARLAGPAALVLAALALAYVLARAIRMIADAPDDAPDAALAMGAAGDAGDDARAPLPPRCTARDDVALAAGSYEMGDAWVLRDRVLVGVARNEGGKRVAGLLTLARAGDDVTAPHVDDVGELLADAPPPKALVLGGAPVLAFFPRPQKGGARELAIGAARIAQQSDSSFAFDVAPRAGPFAGEAAVVWDEDAAGAPRGVVKLALLPPSPAAGGGAPRVVSPDGSDADSPRIAARPGGAGYWIAWLAKKPEPERDAAPELEGPGETRQSTWLEVAQVDAAGAPIGAPVRVARAGAHVESFDLAARDDALDLLVKDDEQPGDGEGARLVLVTLRGADVSVRVIAPRGVGGGVPDLLPSAAIFRDLTDRARAIPLATDTPDAGPPRESLEPALDDARPLAALGGRVLAGFPRDSAKPLGLLRCFAPDGKQ